MKFDSLIVYVLILSGFVIGAGVARSQVQSDIADTMKLSSVVEITDFQKPPSSINLFATFISTNPESHTMTVEFLNPYNGTQSVRAHIEYSDAIFSKAYSKFGIIADSDVSSLNEGDRLVILVNRSPGLLRANKIIVTKYLL